ncbi:MAG: tetratricopeptide repeat protein [bacterium]|nr:tetratricopeptide repeat protein [bacterium]
MKTIVFFITICLISSGCIHLEPKITESDIYSIYTIGSVYEEKGLYEQALKEYLLIDKISPNPVIKASIANVYFALGKHEKAQAYAAQAISLDPKSIISHFILGNIYYQQKAFEKAVAEIEQVVALEPENVSAVYLLARSYAMNGNIDSATNNYKKVMELYPSNISAYLELADICIDHERYAESIGLLEKVILLNPEEGGVFLTLASIYEFQGDNQKAKEYYHKGLDLLPTHVQGRKKLLLLYFGENNTDAVIEQAINLLRIEPGDAVTHFILGTAYKKKKMLDEASKELKAAISLEKNISQAYIQLAYIYLYQKKTEEAASILNKSINLFSSNQTMEIPLLLGLIYLQNKQYEKAIEIYRRILWHYPDNQEAWYRMGMANERLKHINKSADCFYKCIKINPKHANAYNYIGYMYAERKIRLDDAVRLIHKALEIEPENGAFLDSLGWAYYQQNNMDAALKNLERAYKLMSNDPVVAGHLADVYQAIGKNDDAARLRNKAKELSGNPEVLDDEIQEMEKDDKHTQERE